MRARIFRSSSTRSVSWARSMATAAKFASAVIRSRSSSVKRPMWIGESTCTAPMTWFLFQSGTHIAERMPWMAIDFPPRRRASSSAFEVIRATCCCATMFRIVREIGMSRPSAPSMNRVSFGTGSPCSSKRMIRPRSTGRYLKMMSMTVLSSDSRSSLCSSTLATWTSTWNTFSRDAATSRMSGASETTRGAVGFSSSATSRPNSELKSEMRRITVPEGLSNIDSPVKFT